MSDFVTLVDYLTTAPENPDFHADTLLIAGNSLPYLIISAAKFCETTAEIQRVIFVGGFGHGTTPLIANCQKSCPELVRPEWEQLSEAEIIKEIFSYYCLRDLLLFLEKRSTNTGENARFSYQLFDHEPPQKFWLVQDPLVQKRSHLTFSKEWQLPLSAIQPLFFEQPKLIEFDHRPYFENEKMDMWWTADYFLSLVIGEIRRLKDDENGYGPKGADFIPHVDIPEKVLTSYRRCQKYITGNPRI
ncbi:YdcF family protein [Enterococcus dongliensis]|uniref:YdcF family protein n=1 Tax=Enterococcus dongliensis TaxID=2559925 RepID=UPI00288E8C20|nr:ElyC/SanA/YdcF family protein [Enterococcus dongliensis]MDT2613209.1 ElyC/SanA/YdcF family protein [Enterococcus dongliensis]